jgi:hypothetical protein
VVSDHAAVPPTAELHADVAPDERMGEGKGGMWNHLEPFPPHGSEGVAMVGTGGQRPKDLSPRGRYREESLREDDKVLSPRSSLHVQ